jgi:hypothetical protein
LPLADPLRLILGERRKVVRDQQKAAIKLARKNRKQTLILPRATDSLKYPYHQPASLPEAASMMAHFVKAAYARYYAGNPCLDHLMTLTKFNVLRAFIQNFTVLGLALQEMDDDILSPFNSALSGTSDTRPSWNVPPSLSPTVVQIHVPHHPWLDCFPFPQVRDNIIRVAQLFNDCDLCTDIMDPANGDVGMMVWGDPWVPQNWEVSELFVRKWSWVINGCPEIILASNFWRARRGLKRLDLSRIPLDDAFNVEKSKDT